MSLSSPVRTLMTAGSLLLIWLVSALPASAAPGRAGAAGPVCDPQTTTLRKLARVPRSYGGPLKQAGSLFLRFGLSDPTARVVRGSHANVDRDQAAIQNDAPAARFDEDSGAIPALRPLERLARAVDARPRSPTRSPRAPRGPPAVL